MSVEFDPEACFEVLPTEDYYTEDHEYRNVNVKVDCGVVFQGGGEE